MKLQAQSATLTIAQAFNLAYSYWLAAHERKRRREKERRSVSHDDDNDDDDDDDDDVEVFTGRRHLECSCEKGERRRDRARSEGRREGRSEGRIEGRSEGRRENKPVKLSCEAASDKSPSSGYSSQDSNTEEQTGAQSNTADTLLIDLSSPGREDTWGDINILDTDGDGEDKMRDLSFTDIALRKTGVALLSQLPQDAAQLQIDSFVPPELTVPSVGSLQGAVSAIVHSHSSLS